MISIRKFFGSILYFFLFVSFSCQTQESPVQNQSDETDALAEISPVAVNPQGEHLVELSKQVVIGFQERISEYKSLQETNSFPISGLASQTLGEISVPDPAAGIFTIQDGIDAASPGYEVRVAPGTYSEDAVIATPNINIKADGHVILNGSFLIAANDVGIEGFQINYAGYAGILGDGVSGASIVNNTLSGGAFVGVLFLSGSENTVRDNGIFGSTFGIVLVNSSNNTIKNNTTNDNFANGVHLQENSNYNTIKENPSSNNNRGILAFDCNNNTLRGNTTTGNALGIFLFNSGDNILDKNTVTGSTFSGILLSGENSVNNTIKRNTSSGNDFGIAVVFGASENFVMNNETRENINHGIVANDESNNNLIKGNVSGSNHFSGIALQRCYGNVVVNNITKDNTIMGLDLYDNANENILEDNEISGSRFGLRLLYGCVNNTITGNKSTANSFAGIQILYLSDDNTLIENEANNNLDYGIELDSFSNRNEVRENTALGNGICDIFNQNSTNILIDNEVGCLSSL
jgi:parallel beta-helix repeat protein